MPTSDKKVTDVVVVGVAPEVAAEVRATQQVEQESANAIKETAEGVADDLKTADERREAKLEAREEKKTTEAKTAVRFALGMDALKAVGLAFIVGLPLMITAWRVGDQKAQLDSIHGWVNSGMRIQLEQKYEARMELAMHTMDPKHIRAAELAKQELDEHNKQQAKQDAKVKGQP